ncbi:TPA: hypothetical protein QFK59_002728 [Enterococcus faecium]
MAQFDLEENNSIDWLIIKYMTKKVLQILEIRFTYDADKILEVASYPNAISIKRIQKGSYD